MSLLDEYIAQNGSKGLNQVIVKQTSGAKKTTGAKPTSGVNKTGGTTLLDEYIAQNGTKSLNLSVINRDNEAKPKTRTEKKSTRKPGEIRAFGAGDYGAESDTRLDNIIRAGGYLTASGIAKLGSLLSGGTGALTMGQSAQAAVKGESQQKLENEKKSKQGKKAKEKLNALAHELYDTAMPSYEKATAPLKENNPLVKFTKSMNNGELTMGESARAALNGVSQQQAEAAKMARQNTDVAGKLGRIAGELGINATQMALDAITGPAALVTMGARATGSRALELEELGKSETQQLIGGLTSGLIEVMTEKIGGPFEKIYGKTALSKVTSKFVNSLGKTPAGKAALKIMSDFVSEGMEEVLSDFLNPIADKLTGISDAEWNWDEMYGDAWADEWAHDFLVGGILGMTGGGANLITESISTNSEKTRVAEQIINAGKTEELLEKAYMAGGKAEQLADEYSSDKGNSRKLSDIYDAIQTQTLSEAVSARLDELGAEDSGTAADELVSYITGKSEEAPKGKALQRVHTELTDALNGTLLSTNEWALDAIDVMSEFSRNIMGEAEVMSETEEAPLQGEPETIEEAPVEEPMDMWDMDSIAESMFPNEVKSGILSADDVASIQSVYDNSGRTMDLNDLETMVKEYIATKENENGRNNDMDGSLGREPGESAREQGGKVQSRAAEDKGKNGVGEHRADSGRESVRRKAESSTESKVSAKELGIKEGTEEKNNSVIPESKWSPAEKRIAEAFGPASNGFTLVSHNLSLKNGKANGAKTADGKIVVSRGSRLYKSEQLMIHEGGHLYLDDDIQMVDKLRNAAIEEMSEAEIDELTASYALKWKGLYGDEEAFDRAANGELDTQELEEFNRKYVTEMLCDALGGIDRAGTKGTSKFSEAVRTAFKSETGIDVDALLGGEESKAETETKKTASEAKPKKPRNNGPPGDSYSYAGERAETADRLSLDNAKQMLKDNVDPEIIRQQTGWFKGMDGKWRFEIDDSEAEIRIDGSLSRNPDIRRYKELLDKAYLYDTATKEELDELRSLDKALEGVPLTPRYIGDMLKHDSLYEAYPSIADIEVTFVEESGIANAGINPTGDRIFINNSVRRDKVKLKKSLLHELQHAIQIIEGHAGGASVSYWKGKIDAIPDEIEWTVRQMSEIENRISSDLDARYENGEMTEEEYEKEYYSRRDSNSTFKMLQKRAFELRNEKTQYEGKTPGELYKNTAGEIEARDTANRSELTAEERKNTRPDVDRADVVFADHSGYSMSFDSKNAKSEESKFVVKQILENVNNISAESKFELSSDKRFENYKKKSEYILDIFDKQNNTAYNEIIGTVELVRSGAKSTIGHGYGALKMAAASGIKSVIEHGDVIHFTENYEGNNVDRYIVAAKGTIDGEDTYIGVIIKSYPNTKHNSKFYLHEAVIVKADSSSMTAPQLSVDTVNESASEDSIYTGGKNVNSYSVEDEGPEMMSAEEAQRRKNFQSTVNKESLTKLRERQSRLEGRMAGYMRTGNLTEQMKTELEQMKSDREAIQRAIEAKQKKAERAKQERQDAKAEAAAAVDSLSVRQTTAKSRKAAKQQLYESFGIESGRAEIGSTIDGFLDKWIEQGSIRNADVKALENSLMEQGAFKIESANDYAQEIRNRMRNGQISVPASVVAEFGDDWNAFRQRAFANSIYLSIDSTHAGIDQWTLDLASTFGAGKFDDTADLKTQLENIVDLAEEGKAENLNVYQVAQRMASMEGRDAADAYLDEMHDKLMQTLKSFAQSAKIEMETVKGNVYRTVREQAERKAKAERAAAERSQREFQQKTLKQLQWLKRNQNFMGSDFQDEAKRILSDIDTIAVSAANEMNWSDKYNATWKDIAKMYKKARHDDPNFLPNKEIETILERIDDDIIHLDELSATDLENIYKAAVALRTAYYNRNNIIGDELHRTFAEAYDSSIEDMRQAIKPKNMRKRIVKKDNAFNQMTDPDKQLNPINRIQRMFGWKEDSAGFQIFGRGLEKGERQTKRYVEQANQILDEWMETNKEWVAKADGQGKDAVWYDIEVPELMEMKMGDKPIFGKTVTVSMTPMQKIYMYLESKNYDNLRHMVGGRTFADKELYSAGQKSEAFAHGTTISLAPETVKKLVADLTPTEMELATILERQYFNGYAKTEINRVSNVLYGYDRAMSDNYAPIFTDHNYNKVEPGVMQDGTAEGVGHMKTRVQGAKNPTYNVSALEAFQKHVSQTSRFVGMAIPSQNANTLLNWKANGTTMQKEITHNWSQKELNDLTNVISELESPTYMEQSEFASGLGKLMSNYIGGVFGANITVAAKVLASKPTAAIVLGNQYYPSIAQQRATSTELISKYTSELDVRARGYGTPELAAMTLSTSKYMQWVQSHKATKLLLGGGLLQAADIYVTKAMWPWAENKVRAEYPDLEVGTQEQIDNGTSPFYKKVAEVYEDAIGETQSMYDIMHRSDIMRDSNEITRSFTIFHTDSLQAMNLIRKRAGELNAAKAKLNSAENEAEREAAQVKVNTAGKKVAACVGNVILMNVLVTMFDILRDLFRKRDDKYANDEGEVTFWSFISSSLTQLVENSSGLLIGADTVMPALTSIFTDEKYFSHELIAIETLNDIIELGTDTIKGIGTFVSGLADVIKEDGNAWQFISDDGDFRGVVKDAAEKITHYFTGVPVENVERLITSTIGWIFPQVSAAYDGIWSNAHKKDLAESADLETDISSLYGNRAELSDDAAAELARLYAAGYKNSIISDTPDSLTVDSVEHEISTAKQQKYEQTIKENMGMLDEVIKSAEYQNADDETKAKMLNRLYDYAKDKAKMEVIDGYEGETFTNNVNDWRSSGMSWGRIMSGNTTDINKFAKYIDAGMSEQYAGEVYDAISILEPEFGFSTVSSEQKVMTIAYLPIPENEKEAAMKVAYGSSDKAYNIYAITRNHDVASADYADFLNILSSIDTNGGYPKQTEFEEAINRSNIDTDTARDLWYNGYGWKSTSPWG